MNTNTRKKQIKPKVTINQDEPSSSKSRVTSRRSVLARLRVSRKAVIWLVLIIIFVVAAYFILKSNPKLTNISLMNNDIISEQNEKIGIIENQISDNNQLLRELEKKDQALLRLESQVIELNSMIREISEKNDSITEANDQLLQYVQTENKKKTIFETSKIDFEEELYRDNMQVVAKTNSNENNSNKTIEATVVAQEPDPLNDSFNKSNKKSIISIVLDRIEQNIANNKSFSNEVELLVIIGVEDPVTLNLNKLSDKIIPTPNDLINELELLLEEEIILYKGDGGISSKIYSLIKDQISIKRKSQAQQTDVLNEIRTNIYNDNLKVAEALVEDLNSSKDTEVLVMKINNRKLYLEQIKYLIEKYELN
tara:strand:- start:638 stop:1738 length:1101 start_codon:yes stop_codon:yes gene_type:complete